MVGMTMSKSSSKLLGTTGCPMAACYKNNVKVCMQKSSLCAWRGTTRRVQGPNDPTSAQGGISEDSLNGHEVSVPLHRPPATSTLRNLGHETCPGLTASSCTHKWLKNVKEEKRVYSGICGGHNELFLPLQELIKHMHAM